MKFIMVAVRYMLLFMAVLLSLAIIAYCLRKVRDDSATD